MHAREDRYESEMQAGGVACVVDHDGQAAPTLCGIVEKSRVSRPEIDGRALDRCTLVELIDIILGPEHASSRVDGVSSNTDNLREVEADEPHGSWRLEVDDGALASWSRAEPAHLVRAWRLAPDLALRLAASFALGRLVEQGRMPRRARLQSPVLVHQLMAPRLRGLPVETLHVLLLDGKHRLQRLVRVSEGTLTNAMVHPREVYAPALAERAAAVIAVHNHPSGDPEPSEDDVRVTRRLIDTGVLLGVPLIDHVIVAEGGYVSLRERLRWEA